MKFYGEQPLGYEHSIIKLFFFDHLMYIYLWEWNYTSIHFL